MHGKENELCHLQSVSIAQRREFQQEYVRLIGFGKLNSRVLVKPKYVTEMKELIIKVWDESQDMTDTSIKFNWLKFKIIEYTIKYCKEKARNKQQNSQIFYLI